MFFFFSFMKHCGRALKSLKYHEFGIMFKKLIIFAFNLLDSIEAVEFIGV